MSKPITFKIIVLGNQAVGKTSLLERYVSNKYNNTYRATLGANFLTKKLVIDGRNYILQLWDTAGQELFQSLGTSFYRGSDACVLVFDMTSTKTFESLAPWKEEFLFQIACNEDFPFLVIGNKLDLVDNRVVSNIKAKKWIEEQNLLYFECSAKDGISVDDAFTQLISQIIEYNNKNPRIYNPSMQLKKVVKKKKKCNC